jgi:glutathione S-transferase
MEKILKMTIEEAREKRAEAMSRLTRVLEPMQALLKRQRWIAGEHPAYADYILFSLFQWARIMSPQEVLQPGDPLHGWRQRVLDLHEGFAKV